MRVYTEGVRVPVKSWCEDVEAGAFEQALNLGNLPFAHSHVALMPDCHQGYGMPIGGVLATDGVVVPNAVGVDIGCGMRVVRTSLPTLTTAQVKAVMGVVRRTVPLGFGHHKQAQACDFQPAGPVGLREAQKAAHQVGTLGGGNHFIEIQAGDGAVWAMIHSGSRNVGLQVANHYNKLAVALNERWRTAVPKAHQLAFLPVETEEGQAYLAEMQSCLDFARENRGAMMTRVKEAFVDALARDVTFEGEADVHHNYARIEHHFGRNVYVHRKGATAADEGLMGIIPGSQGSASYLVVGRGSADSFRSCSHGAGRKMSRSKARASLSVEEEARRLDEAGVVHAIRGKDSLDEAPGAYKDIDAVMAQQADLVEVTVALRPLGVVKG